MKALLFVGLVLAGSWAHAGSVEVVAAAPSMNISMSGPFGDLVADAKSSSAPPEQLKRMIDLLKPETGVLVMQVVVRGPARIEFKNQTSEILGNVYKNYFVQAPGFDITEGVLEVGGGAVSVQMNMTLSGFSQSGVKVGPRYSVDKQELNAKLLPLYLDIR